MMATRYYQGIYDASFVYQVNCNDEELLWRAYRWFYLEPELFVSKMIELQTPDYSNLYQKYGVSLPQVCEVKEYFTNKASPILANLPEEIAYLDGHELTVLFQEIRKFSPQ